MMASSRSLPDHGVLERRIAAAPISFGVFGDITLDVTPRELVETIARTGHAGSEMGPPGFFGPADGLQTLFNLAGLVPLGAYVPLHLIESEDIFARDLDQLRRTLEELLACGNPRALAILADEGNAELVAHPFRGPQPRLDNETWSHAVERLDVAAGLVRDAGVEVSFHPHFGTYVEKASEIDRLLATTDLPLCLDTGHLQLGGADPRNYFRQHAERVNHVHVKDVRLAVFEDARMHGHSAEHPWWNELACRLGDGDIDLLGFVSDLVELDYDGWLVIEQDRSPASEQGWAEAVADQAHNAAWLTDAITAQGSAPRQA